MTKYDFQFHGGNPLYCYPTKEIKRIDILSFVVRANLKYVTVRSTKHASSFRKVQSRYNKKPVI